MPPRVRWRPVGYWWILFAAAGFLAAGCGGDSGTSATPTPPPPGPVTTQCGSLGWGSKGSDHQADLSLGVAIDTPVAALGLAGATPMVAAGGEVRWYGPDGRVARRVPISGGRARDLACGADGRLAVLAESMLTVMDSTGATQWTAPVTGGWRVALGADGTAAVAGAGGKLSLFAADGRATGSATVANALQGIAVSGEARLAYACGFTQVSSVLQIPWIKAYDLSGAPKWTAYNQSAAGLGADTRCMDIAAMPGGKLAFVGQQAGGTTPFDRDPSDVSKPVANLGGDAYQRADNLQGAAHIGYIGILDAATGAWAAGTHLVARLPTGKGNTLKPERLAVDGGGNLYVAGSSAYAVAHHDSLSLGGQAMPATGGAFLAAFAPTLCRGFWSTLGSGTVIGVAADGGYAGVLLDRGDGAAFSAQAGAGAYLGVIPLAAR